MMNKGLTIVEIVITLGIFSVAILLSISIITRAWVTAQFNKEKADAESAVNSKLEWLRNDAKIRLQNATIPEVIAYYNSLPPEILKSPLNAILTIRASAGPSTDLLRIEATVQWTGIIKASTPWRHTSACLVLKQ